MVEPHRWGSSIRCIKTASGLILSRVAFLMHVQMTVSAQDVVRGIYSDADCVGLLVVETARHGTGGHGRAEANLIDASGWRSIPHSRFASARDRIGTLCGVAAA